VVGLGTLIAVTLLLDQVVWRPLVAWSERFKVEQPSGTDAVTSRVLDLLRGSTLMAWARRMVAPALPAPPVAYRSHGALGQPDARPEAGDAASQRWARYWRTVLERDETMSSVTQLEQRERCCSPHCNLLKTGQAVLTGTTGGTMNAAKS